MKQLNALIALVLVFITACQSEPVAPSSGGQPTTVGEGLYSTSHIDFAKVGLGADCCEAKGTQVAIASGGQLSSQAGLDTINAGGNAVDAAIAVAFALGVERPQSTGIGGGGFFTLHLKDKGNHIVDFRETAPAKSTKTMFLDKEGNPIPNLSTVGAMSVATPGLVAGMYDLHKKFGKLSWSKILQPAIKMAETGIPVTPTLASRIAMKKELAADPEAQKIFFKDGQPLAAGDTLVQKDLAQTLKAIAAKGKAGFYSGPVAKKISDYLKKQKGILGATDLSRYKVKFSEPLSTTYKGYVLLSPPPPSSGGLVIGQMLEVLEGYDVKKAAGNPVDYTHLLAETMRRSYADRSVFVGDPAFFNSDYLSILTPTYIESLRKSISMDKATLSSDVRPGAPLLPNDSGTAHVSIIDADGNAISGTVSINGSFGAALVVPGTGIVLNNTMDDFSVKPGVKNVYGLVGNEGNSIAPAKRPVSSMTPLVVLNEATKVPVLALGGGGGARIISADFQVFINYTEIYPGDLRKSVFAPRLHHQWIPDKLFYEPGFSDGTIAKLKSKGHDVVTPPPTISESQAVSFNPETHTLTAVFDPRVNGGSVAK